MPLQPAGKAMIVAASLLIAQVAGAGDAARGEKLAYACMGCHGIENYKNAYPAYSVPRLGGQHPTYIAYALEQYVAGNRPHPTMRGFASSLTAEDRADIAAFFSAQAPAVTAPPVGTPPPQAAACAACHGKDGRGTTPDYPNIGGQHADYIAHALNAYRLGKRKNPIMAPFAQQLTPQDIAALAEYFSAQPGLVTAHHED